MLQTLSDRPKITEIEAYIDDLLATRGAELEFIVLFGSMARGDWSHGSDYDILIGLREDDDKRFIDRALDFSAPRDVNVEIFAYSRPEWERMFESFHPLLLETLEHGIVLWDEGAYAEMQATFRRLRESGQLKPWRSGWKIADSVA